MRSSIFLFSLSSFAAAVSASAIPQTRQEYEQRDILLKDWLAKRQTKANTSTIPVLNFGPSGTVPVATSPVASATSTQPARGTNTTSPAKTKASSTVSGTVAVTGTGNVPVFNYFPSSTVPAGIGATSQPSAGNGAGNSGGKEGGSGDGRAGQTGGQTDPTQEIADLLNRLLDLLGN